MQQFFQAFGGMMGGMAMPHGPGFVWEETLRAYSMAVAGKDIKDGDKSKCAARRRGARL